MWVTLAFASAFFAGLTSILAKVGLKNINSNLATAVRTIVVVIFAWMMVVITGSFTLQVDSRSLLFLTLSGIATGASWLCYYKALKIGDVSKVVPVDKSSTIMTMLLAFIVLGEDPGFLKTICMILIATGTVLMTVRFSSKEDDASGTGESNKTGKVNKTFMLTKTEKPAKTNKTFKLTKAEKPAKINKTFKLTKVSSPLKNTWFIYAFLAAVFASLTAILGKVGITGIDATFGTAYRTVVVLVMAWLIVFIQGGQREIKQIDKKSGLFLILSGVATGACWLCFYTALQLGPASVVVPIDKLSIVITVTFGAIVFKEKLKLKSIAGLALIVAGTIWLIFL